MALPYVGQYKVILDLPGGEQRTRTHAHTHTYATKTELAVIMSRMNTSRLIPSSPRRFGPPPPPFTNRSHSRKPLQEE